MTELTSLTVDWPAYQATLSETGFALLPPVLSPDECRQLADLFDAPDLYRKAIVMQKHGYGSGEYKYFSYPLPPVVDALRHELFPKLAPVANTWNEQLGIAQRYPTDLDAWLATCHAAGQTRPTPLILKYGVGDWNALHQDMYGDLHSQKLLDFGVEKVLWIITSMQRVCVIDRDEPTWRIVDWLEDIAVPDDCVLNIKQLLGDEEIAY